MMNENNETTVNPEPDMTEKNEKTASKRGKKDLFEKNLKELEQVVRELESGDASLDEMLSLFEKGIKLTKECTTALDNAEQKINILMRNRDTGELEERPFSGAGE